MLMNGRLCMIIQTDLIEAQKRCEERSQRSGPINKQREKGLREKDYSTNYCTKGLPLIAFVFGSRLSLTLPLD